MKRPSKKKKPKPRLPISAVIKLGSHAITTKKGVKGYDRTRSKKQTVEIIEEEKFEEKN
ncbi:MAG: hypothetical protein AB1348_01680 [Nitrospirota bacterium]